MKIMLDGENLFGEQELDMQVGSWKRDSVEKTVAGLDGVLSIDMGKRSRLIKQSGVLNAVSRERLDEKIAEISALMDGGSHTLAVSDGREFDNVRIDNFQARRRIFSGNGVCCEYQVVYTQLK